MSQFYTGIRTTSRKIRRQKPWIVLALVGGACVPTQAQAQTNMFLGAASSFAVLGGSTVTNTGFSVIHGDVGVSPGTAITGFGPGMVQGNLYTGGMVPAQAQIANTMAYNTLAGETSTHDLTGQNLGGLTLTPGVYHFDSSAQLTGQLTLNNLGDPNALFVFQIGSTLTTASNASVHMINGGNDDDVYFQVGSSATLGTGTAFEGNILALTSITLDTGATILDGRALAQNGAVMLDSNLITVPRVQPNALTPEGSSAFLLLSGCLPLSGMGLYRWLRRKRAVLSTDQPTPSA